MIKENNESENPEKNYKLFKKCYEKLEITEDQLEEFEKLTSDEERINFINEIVSYEKLPFIKIIENTKDEKLARDLKELGNEAFRKANFSESLNYYTKSIMETPQKENTTNLALTLANRSAAFYHLQEYELAINDIDLVLQLNYPKELRFKVLERKAKSYLALQRNEEALSQFRNTIKALDDCKLPVEKKLKMQTDIQVMLRVMSKSVNNSDGNKHPAVSCEQRQVEKYKPRLSSGRNKNHVAASDSIEIKEEPLVGRYAAAAADINAGDTLLIEKPYCSVLLTEYFETNCQHCFKRTLSPQPCTNCSAVIFCSLQCRNLATYHKYECPILRTLHESGVSVTVLMALRILTQRNLEYFLSIKSKLTESRELGEKYESLDYVRVYNLVRHESRRKPKDFLERTILALFLLRCLKEVNYFNDFEKGGSRSKLTNEEIFIGSLLLRHLQILQFNAHEISELEMKNKKNIDNSKSNFIGGGLYPTLALFNHSCDPGIARYFDGTKIIVRAIRPIKKGEIVAENYGPIYSQMKKEERQENLLAQYWFDCTCTPCEELWPVFDELDTKIIRFRCEGKTENGDKCKNVLLVPVNTEEFMIKCSVCGRFMNLFKGLKALQDTDILYKQAIKDANSGNYQAALSIYLEILTVLHEILAPPFRDYLLCQQSIRKCMLALGNKFSKDS